MAISVLLSDTLSEEGLRLLRTAPNLKVDVKTGLPEKELVGLIKSYDALVVRSGTKVTKPIIEAADNLKVIGRAGTGVDNIDVEAATKKGIIVMNTPGGNTITTAEHTFAMIMALARKIPHAHLLLHKGKWAKGELMGTELFGKTLGIIGLGKIGRVVAERALAFKMNVVATDPYVTAEAGRKMGVEIATLDDVLRRADILTVHTPLTNETTKFLNDAIFEKMKPGVLLVNCARGELMDEDALLRALKSGRIAGAALDVFHKEPLPADHPLLGLDNVITTPHLGAATKEAQVNVAVAVAQQIIEFFANGVARGAVNFPSVTPETLELLQPYMNLAEKIGLLQSQMFRGKVEEIRIEYSGLVAGHETEPITLSALKGFFTPLLTDRVTFVNAPVIARDRGIRVEETKSRETKDFVSLLSITVGGASPDASSFRRPLSEAGGGGASPDASSVRRPLSEAGGARNRLTVAGTLFGQKEPRLVRINDFTLEAVPEGTILIFENDDKPGVIGNVGTTLGRNGVNIAGMANGRLTAGGRAIALYNIDSRVPPALLEELAKLPHIRSALQVQL